MLYIVSTPIGNLEDISFRAVRTLKEVDLITAEDTRHSKRLLDHYEIKTPMISYHSYSGNTKIEKIIDELKAGKNVAVISDAGTPGISDPAYRLVRRAIEENIQICPIPGASSLLAAIVVSGKATHEFLYLGFLPMKKGRQTLLNNLKEEKRTIIIFESPHRILKSLKQFAEVFGEEREIVIARELTKMHEEILRLPLNMAVKHFEKINPKGEFVLVL